MNIVKETTEFLNPGQIPVICMDQPLFALANQIQWANPHVFGEDKFIVMMGDLHIEMDALKVVGHWLKCSGWDKYVTVI